jgi:hypothetical protein
MKGALARNTEKTEYRPWYNRPGKRVLTGLGSE